MAMKKQINNKEYVMFIVQKIKKSIVCASAMGCAFSTEVVVPGENFCIFSQPQTQQTVQERIPVTHEFTLAKEPVLIANQLRANKNTLLSAVSGNIFDLDLSGVNFSDEEGQAILKTIKGKKFPNLRSINLHNATSVAEFLSVILENDAQLYSLVSIDATGSDSDIKLNDIEYLTKYYAQCPHVLRDMEQYDARREMPVSLLRVAVDRISDFSDSSYIRGSFLSSEKLVYIRSEQQYKKVPFSLLVGR